MNSENDTNAAGIASSNSTGSTGVDRPIGLSVEKRERLSTEDSKGYYAAVPTLSRPQIRLMMGTGYLRYDHRP